MRVVPALLRSGAARRQIRGCIDESLRCRRHRGDGGLRVRRMVYRQRFEAYKTRNRSVIRNSLLKQSLL